MGWLSHVEAEDVTDARSYANYCQERLGIPYPTKQQLVGLQTQIKDFFSVYPHTDYHSLIRLCDWAKARHRRFATVNGLLSGFRYAWAAGYLPELDPGYRPVSGIDTVIQQALRVEKDLYWRDRLQSCYGSGREVVLGEWRTMRDQRVIS
jgi:hypothetical protein